MAKPCSAWMADDGSLHEKEDDAKGRDFEIALKSWANDHAPRATDGGEAFLAVGEFVNHMIADRMTLLKVFKLLNGGNPSPPSPPKLVQTN